LVVGVCARAPGLTSVRDPAVRWIGDVMFDGVIPLGEACCGRSFFLGRPPGVSAAGSRELAASHLCD
jgi:hypothetical protein